MCLAGVDMVEKQGDAEAEKFADTFVARARTGELNLSKKEDNELMRAYMHQLLSNKPGYPDNVSFLKGVIYDLYKSRNNVAAMNRILRKAYEYIDDSTQTYSQKVLDRDSEGEWAYSRAYDAYAAKQPRDTRQWDKKGMPELINYVHSSSAAYQMRLLKIIIFKNLAEYMKRSPGFPSMPDWGDWGSEP